VVSVRGNYQTKQRNIILSCLFFHQEESLCAKELYLYCQAEGTPVGLATIYRQLELLAREGKVQKIVPAAGSGVVFQYLNSPRLHDNFFLKCDCCGHMTPLDCGFLEEMTSHMQSAHGFQINPVRSVLYGRCEQCQ